MASRRIKPRRLTVSDQRRMMERHCPQFQIVRSTNPGIVWLGQLRPSPLSIAYTIEICYRRRRKPQVWVRHPELRITPEQYRFAHIYSEGCLCLNADDEWSDCLPIATTVVGWISEWLLYYEIWRATGQWMGGGEYRVRSVTDAITR